MELKNYQKKVIADFTKEYLSQKTQTYKNILESFSLKKKENIDSNTDKNEVIADGRER